MEFHLSSESSLSEILVLDKEILNKKNCTTLYLDVQSVWYGAYAISITNISNNSGLPLSIGSTVERILPSINDIHYYNVDLSFEI